MLMDSQRAAQELQDLRQQAETPEVCRSGPAHRSWKAKVDAVVRAVLGADSETLREFREVRYHVGIWTGAPGENERDARYFASQVGVAAALIDAAIYELELRNDQREGGSVADGTAADGPIFVVHGRDDARKYELIRLLDRAVEREAIVLHEQASRGDTILEKLERHAEVASFAIVLLTSDDEGRLRGDSTRQLRLRGRQNVILETGVFIGRLGRSRVVILQDPDVEQPSDLHGLLYIPLDSAGGWRHTLLTEIDAAGISVDFSRIPPR